MDLVPPTPAGKLRAALLLGLPVGGALTFLGLATRMPGESFHGPPAPPPAALADLPARLEAHVVALATTIGAHYDSVVGTPGADDNASGVAGMLEVARLIAEHPLPRTVRFVAWVNEEPPAFQKEAMGSLVDAKAARARGDDLRAVFALECLGTFSDAPGSQVYPQPFAALYPSVGDFIGVVGNFEGRSLVRHTVEVFRRHAQVPSEGLAGLEVIPGVGWSNHWAYWQVGYPALMITDTAPFRNHAYHEAGDVPARLDYVRMARVVEGAVEGVVDVVREAAGG